MIKDVEPLLKECKETLAELKSMGDMNGACYVQGFINSINKLPNVERPQWIPCSKQVPSENKRVLITRSNGAIEIIRWNQWWYEQTQYPTVKPTAWMPLPEPYREEGGEE